MMSLPELLQSQDVLLDNLLALLQQEKELLQQRQALALPDLAKTKQQLLEQLQSIRRKNGNHQEHRRHA